MLTESSTLCVEVKDVNVYMKDHVFELWRIYDITKWPAPSGLMAQSVEHCTGITEVMGSNPVQA